MRVIKLTKTDSEPVLVNYYENKKQTERVLIIIGGSGMVRSQFKNIVKLLINKNLNSDIATLSFRGTETNNKRPGIQQFIDLKELLDYLLEKNKAEISIVCTSMGAISTTLTATMKRYGKYINNIIYLDPADYPKAKNFSNVSTWTGFANFSGREKTLSSELTKLNPNTKVNVVFFTIRNFGKDGYTSENLRGKDNPKLFTRLNKEMVNYFYSRTPKKNRGEYIELNKISHAFVRDGNVQANEKRVVNLILRLIR